MGSAGKDEAACTSTLQEKLKLLGQTCTNKYLLLPAIFFFLWQVHARNMPFPPSPIQYSFLHNNLWSERSHLDTLSPLHWLCCCNARKCIVGPAHKLEGGICMAGDVLSSLGCR